MFSPGTLREENERVAVLMGLLWISLALVFDRLELHFVQILFYGLRWLLGRLLVGIAEEGLECGYALTSIARIFGVLSGVLITAFVFAAGCTGNTGETLLGFMQVLLFGAGVAFGVFRTDRCGGPLLFTGRDWARESLTRRLGADIGLTDT